MVAGRQFIITNATYQVALKFEERMKKGGEGKPSKNVPSYISQYLLRLGCLWDMLNYNLETMLVLESIGKIKRKNIALKKRRF